MRRRVLLLLALLLLGLARYQGLFAFHPDYPALELQPGALLQDDRLDEPSGLVESSRNPGFFWSHNDSGGEPKLFAVTAEGQVHQQSFELEGASSVDWEAVARWEQTLYITDLGNNLNSRQDLGVYQLEEPELGQSGRLSARFLPVAYPEQAEYPPSDGWDYDCEAAFCFDGKLYVLTKNRPPYRLWVQAEGCHLYRLDSYETERTNILTRVDSAHGLQGWVTAADASKDGRWIALLCESPVQSVWLFERPLKGDKLFSEPSSVLRCVVKEAGQAEAIAFEGEDLLVLNEEGEFFRVSRSSFEPVEWGVSAN